MDPLPTLMITLVAVILAGLLALWLGYTLGKSRGTQSSATAVAELAASKQSLAALQADIATERQESANRVAAEREAGERRVAAETQRSAEQLTQVREQHQLELSRERQRGTEQLEAMRADQARLEAQFAALSKQALEQNSEQFLVQAEERLKRAHEQGDAVLKQRQLAVEQLVEPIKVSLETVKAEVTTAEKARAVANAALTEQIATMRKASDSLGQETQRLVNALRSSHVRGRWGELQLRRVVESAGMLNHVDFEEQESHVGDDGALRPDMVVKLSDGKRVVVDSKVAFHGYLEALEATDDATRVARLKAHAGHLKKHIDDLGSKEYWDAVAGSPEFVVMFVPAEPFLTAALDQDSTLFEHAFDRNVVIATPSTLVALLRTVGHVWRQDQLAKDAQEIFLVGKELHKRLGVMGDHLAALGKRINATVETFNKLSGSLDRNVVTQVRRFSDLQGLEPSFVSTPPVETLAIAPQKGDLYGPVDEFEATIEATVIAEELEESTAE